MQAPQIRTTPYPIMLGTNFPMAVGTALSDKLAGNGQVSLAFIGEGSTSEGDFHDGLGLAGVLQAPTIFFIQNNQWCISIPAGRQTAAKTFAQKAVAHGLPWRRVDGNDVFAVYAAVRDAVERARAGDGATVIEGVTYRMFDHNSADSAVRYREETEPERWVARDPLTRFEAYLLQTGLLTEAAKSKMYEAAEAEVREAIRRAQAIPPTPPQAIFLNHLHGDEGWTVSREKWELEEELHGRNPFSEDNLFPGQNAA
jgi:pyruvate dehydrogenase E1 component alpha subunit